VDEDGVCFAFVGDATFFASGMTGVVNAVYNEANMILCVLDNSTTAMTGQQPHPGTGLNLMGEFVDKVSIQKVLEG
ncbi:thiamine pyrophosphate-dependent enzyme, partial [Coprococcus eutactus]|uniref:thiamine pyrophosphate-dependent enzyme n=1 Tax=Coprococcus eutactus TaxID=33043 RepID=UPI00210A1E71